LQRDTVMPAPIIPTLQRTSGRLDIQGRRSWAAGLSFVSYGIKVGLRSNNAALMEQLLELLPPGWKPINQQRVQRIYSVIAGEDKIASGSGKRGRGLNMLYADDAQLAKSREIDGLLERFEADLQLFVAESAQRRVFIHSGVVAWRGRAILIPGRSFSGKTTLVAELVRAGALYYSDEYAVLDSRGRVHPYPKPLGIRKDSSFDQTKFPVESLGGAAGARSIPVGMIVVSRYKAGTNWRPQRLSAGKSALELLSNAVPARKRPAAALDVLQKVVSAAPTLKGLRGDAAKTARLILQRLDESL
jgi:hypothetical protein